MPKFDVSTIRNGTPLYYAYSFGLSQAVEMLLAVQGKAQLDLPSGRLSSTPLEVAAFRRHKDIIRLLLEAGADPNIQSSTGTSALYWAVARGDDEIRDLLLAYGATQLIKESFSYY
jgi:ankyrin repeat protein